MKILIIDEKGITELVPLKAKANGRKQWLENQKTPHNKVSDSELMESNSSPKVYSISKLLQLFETTRPTIYSWIDKGLLKPIKLGGRVYFNSKDIDNLLDEKQ